MKLWKNTIYPLFVFTFAYLFILFKDSVSEPNLPLLVAGLSIMAILVTQILEWLIPYKKEWNKNLGDFTSDFLLTNIILPILSKIVEISVGIFLVMILSQSLATNIQNLWPRQSPFLVQVIIAVVIAEFFFYWTHRLSHTVHFLWRFHAIHHAVKRLYWNNSGRFHPVDLTLNWIFYFFPLILLHVPADVMAMFLLLNALTGLWEHANVDFNAGWFNYIFNTGELHRWHHSIEPEISSQNFGKILCVWDLIFGSWYLPKNQQVGEIGIHDDTYPQGALDQIIYPFKQSEQKTATTEAVK